MTTAILVHDRNDERMLNHGLPRDAERRAYALMTSAAGARFDEILVDQLDPMHPMFDTPMGRKLAREALRDHWIARLTPAGMKRSGDAIREFLKYLEG